MKWWYVIFLVVGVALGWWLIGKYGVKVSTKVDVVEGEKKIVEMGKGLRRLTISDKEGNMVEVVQVMGRVLFWDYETGILEFKHEEKTWRVKIDVEKTTILVDSFINKNNSINVVDKNDPNWRTGFCLDDEVVLRLKGDEVVIVVNNGPRNCGFKDK